MQSDHSSCFSSSFTSLENNVGFLDIKVSARVVDTIFLLISQMQQEQTSVYGFAKGAAPLSYIQEHYRPTILDHVQEFIFKFFIIDQLYEALLQKKIAVISEPILHAIELEPGKNAIFTFAVSHINPIEFREWKHFLFKVPKRKNYKDIDRQVENFIKEEQHLAHQFKDAPINIGDWVLFELELISNQKKSILNSEKSSAWIKIGSEEADVPFQQVFLGKRKDDQFITNSTCLQEYFSHNLPTHYQFSLTIQHVIPYNYFCFDSFKHHFRLKTNKELHQKLIEIFSFRNDILLRQAIVDEALHLLITKHHVRAEDNHIDQQKKVVLGLLQNTPDYSVYKTEQGFKDTLKKLATKQVSEIMLIDQLIFHEHISANAFDMRGYLTLLQRPRTKEFIYFMPPESKIDGQETPLPTCLIKRSCLREKALNHIIYHLTRN